MQAATLTKMRAARGSIGGVLQGRNAADLAGPSVMHVGNGPDELHF